MKRNFMRCCVNFANHSIICSFYTNIPIRSKTDENQSGSLIINNNSSSGILDDSIFSRKF